MSNKWGVKPEQAEFLIELENTIGESIEIMEDIKWSTFGVQIDGDIIVGLGLCNCNLISLPESIGNLKSLQKLHLLSNQLTSLPESITNLKSLYELNLHNNKLASLPESITNLKSLQTLLLSKNKLVSLPESIANLKSLYVLDLHNNKLASLSESITNLRSLQKLDLSRNKLITLPESITNLRSLSELNLHYNKLVSLPESITNLRSLQKLDLSRNKLTSLPELIGNLERLQELDLFNNRLTSLPESLWQLNNLEDIKLGYNLWKGEWKELAKRDAITLRRILKQKVSINIFISHTVNEFASYRIKELAEYLEQQPEINQVYFCEEDLKGNIDVWMAETVPKSHLLLLIGTKQSKFSKDCTEEIRLARVNNIPIIPIKGLDVSWEELEKIGLSREFGFEFDEKIFEKLCADLYKYICEYKRKKDLLGKEQGKIQDSKLAVISTFKDKLSEIFNETPLDKFSEIESLEKEFKSNKITFPEFLRRLGDILD
ncbi:MAG: leucine-rich repeat domain-containing protein [Promethearchaeota archaeon]|jgi:hypothetical protein